jgi:hypothetical protein
VPQQLGDDTFAVAPKQAADSGYSKRRLWVRKDITLTVKQEYFDKKGRLEKVGIPRQLVNVRGSMWRPNEAEMRDAQTGNRTVVTVESRRLDQGLKRASSPRPSSYAAAPEPHVHFVSNPRMAASFVTACRR